MVDNPTSGYFHGMKVSNPSFGEITGLNMDLRRWESEWEDLEKDDPCQKKRLVAQNLNVLPSKPAPTGLIMYQRKINSLV